MQEEKFDYEAEIWNVANLVWGPIKTSEFNKVILPFTMLRRLECALEPTRDAVVKALEENEKVWGRENDHYCNYSKKAFYNVTAFRLSSIGSTDTYDALVEYINGFSPNAREIMLKFKMEETCKTLNENGLLYAVCQKFASFDLSPKAVSDRDMSNIYEHLIRRFGESIAENAEDFMTPKDIVRLAVGMVFASDEELMNSDTGIVRTICDPCIGTAGFISDAMDQLEEWHSNKKMVAPAVVVPYGQEVEPESWAMAKAAMLLRNVSNSDSDIYDSTKDISAHIMYGNTLSDDKFEGMTFNYILTNPPYGKSYENEKDAVVDEASLGFSGRFGAGIPPISDSSMLFLQNVANKLAPEEEGGGIAAIVLSGSPLFTGDAGSGCSNIRRWLFKQDLIDCIVKIGTSEFYRTGINTYLWILSTKKPEGRKGMIQLIDASGMKTPLKKSLGNKRFELSKEQRDEIVRLYADGIQNDISVIVPAEDFKFRKITTQRPMHAAIIYSEENLAAFYKHKALAKLSEENRAALKKRIDEDIVKRDNRYLPYESAETIAKAARNDMTNPELAVSAIAKAIRDTCVVKNPEYPLVYEKSGKVMADPDLKDTENVPFGTSLEEYMKREVLPFAPETWIDETVCDVGPLTDMKVGVVGTNISFNKFFYRYEEPRRPEEIAKEILDIENGLEAFMEGFLK